MAAKNIKWFKVADSKNELQWQDNNLMVAEAGGKKITLARVAGEVHACAYKCPHASGILADGFIDATGNIVCPLHRYRFSLTNGRNISGEGYYLKVYAIEEREAGIFVGFEENSWINIFK
ncbi:MAG: ferredoxin [Segetibacter sp.]|nr:ferredoxin [Segetibacter sp.]